MSRTSFAFAASNKSSNKGGGGKQTPCRGHCPSESASERLKTRQKTIVGSRCSAQNASKQVVFDLETLVIGPETPQACLPQPVAVTPKL